MHLINGFSKWTWNYTNKHLLNGLAKGQIDDTKIWFNNNQSIAAIVVVIPLKYL